MSLKAGLTEEQSKEEARAAAKTAKEKWPYITDTGLWRFVYTLNVKSMKFNGNARATSLASG